MIHYWKPMAATLVAGTLVLAGCSKSTTSTGATPTDTSSAASSSPAATAPAAAVVTDSKAADLRTTINLVFAEHLTIAVKAVDAALNGKTNDFNAYGAVLNTNGTDIGALIGQVYGADAAKAFNGIWSAHNADFVEYTTASAAKDATKMKDAVTKLTGTYIPQFSALIAGATGLPTATVTDLTTTHILTTKAVVDDLVAKNYTQFGTDLRMAYAHMQKLADPVAEAIAGQKPDVFPGDAKNKGVDTRVALNNLLQEHLYLATQATQDFLIGNTPEFTALGTELNKNGNDICAAVGSVYGADAATACNGIWSAHNADFVQYTQAIAAGDAAKATAAVTLLTGTYIPDFSKLLAGATSLPQDAVAGLLTDHILTTKAVVDAQLKDVKATSAANATAVAAADRMAAQHMEKIGDPLAKAIVASKPAAFQ